MTILQILELVIPLLWPILWWWIITYCLDLRRQKSDHYLNSPITYDVYSNLVKFSEEYIKELYSILDILTAKRATDEILLHTRELCNIRRKYIMYLNKKITSDLEDYEYALRALWAEAGYLKSLPVWPERSQSVKYISERYRELLHVDQKSENNNKSIDTFIEEIKLTIWITNRINWLLEKTSTPPA